MVDIENHNAISPCYGADEAEVEDEADGHDGAVEREEGRLPPAGPPQPRRKVRLGALHVAALAAMRCMGVRTCSYTGKQHVQLTGSAHGGGIMARLAQEFPISMSRTIARLLLSRSLGSPTRLDHS